MNEHELRERIKLLRAPEEEQAEERSLRVARAAYAARPPERHRRRRFPVRAALALALCAAVLASVAVTPAGSWIRDQIGTSESTPEQVPQLGRLPTGGRLLVVSPRGAWVVHPDGSRRFLGDYEGAAWSPHGLFVAAWRGSELAALEPDATEAVRWTLDQPAISAARWSPSGFRIAYRSRDALRIVAGDGSGDHELAARVGPVAPAWRPIPRHELAYQDASGRLILRDGDTGEVTWRSRRQPTLVALEWIDQDTLAAATSRQVLLFTLPAGEPVRTEMPAGMAIGALAVRPGGADLALSLHSEAAATGWIQLLAAGAGRARLLAAGGGPFTDLTWSPDGSYLLASWRQAGQWLFLPAAPGGPTRTVSGVNAIFEPQAMLPPMPIVTGWCCRARQQ